MVTKEIALSSQDAKPGVRIGFGKVLLRGSEYTRRRVAATVLATGLAVTAPTGWEAVMQVAGNRCKPEGTHTVKTGDSLNGIVNKNHPRYNPFERFGAEACMADANGIKKPDQVLTVGSELKQFGVQKDKSPLRRLVQLIRR